LQKALDQMRAPPDQPRLSPDFSKYDNRKPSLHSVPAGRDKIDGGGGRSLHYVLIGA
jgi:hypothetical protein